MNATELQQWLVDHGQTIAVDGKAGPATRGAIIAAFSNGRAPAVTPADITLFASTLGCTSKQLNAVAAVESSGIGFDKQGRPKILYERHIFHRLTDGRYSPTTWSDPKGGGYTQDSWAKLTLAACREPDEAFASCSWGRFQIMGMHWSTLGYPSPIDMAHSMVENEAAHFDALARFIKRNGLQDELRAISSDPDDCRPFARAYNGSGYERFDYHSRIARAMR